MKIDGNLPIAALAADLPGAMAIFEALGLDYACAGDRSLDDAAHAEGIAPEVVIASLRRLKSPEQAESWGDRPLADLTHHLVEQHHRFVREELARIAVRLADLCGSSGVVPADLMSLRAAFARLSEIVLPHLHREDARAGSPPDADGPAHIGVDAGQFGADARVAFPFRRATSRRWKMQKSLPSSREPAPGPARWLNAMTCTYPL